MIKQKRINKTIISQNFLYYTGLNNGNSSVSNFVFIMSKNNKNME